jgi:membrane protease YdiL (CAAX protease family)
VRINLRAGHLSNALSLFLLLFGLFVAIVAGSLLATGLSALAVVASGSELPSFPELANQAMETDHWMILAEVGRGIASLGLVALMIERFDGRAFRFTDVGMAWRPNPGLMVLSGLLVMSVLFLGAGGVATVRGVDNGVAVLAAAFSQTGASGLFVLIVSALANAFWQELAFRGYLQPRLQRSYGALPGILICSFAFVVLHGLVRPLSMTEVITGTLLFCLVGWLYFVSNSMALATALHATGNFYLLLFSEVEMTLPPYFDRILVFSLGLTAALVVFRGRLSPTPTASPP